MSEQNGNSQKFEDLKSAWLTSAYRNADTVNYCTTIQPKTRRARVKLWVTPTKVDYAKLEKDFDGQWDQRTEQWYIWVNPKDRKQMIDMIRIMGHSSWVQDYD